jgi:hypothetical protein
MEDDGRSGTEFKIASSISRRSMIVTPTDKEFDDRDAPMDEPKGTNPYRERPDCADETPPNNRRPRSGTATEVLT